MENSLAVPQEVKQLPYDPEIPQPKYVSKRTENMSTQKLVNECS